MTRAPGLRWPRRPPWLGLLLGLLLVAGGLVGCAAAQKAAQEDPMRCERGAKCDKKRGGLIDCSRQCNDDPACMDRCEQVQQSTGGTLGH